MSEKPPPSNEPRTFAWWLVIGIWVVSMAASLPIAVMFFYPDEWSLGRRLAAGVLMGVGTGLILTANRLIGKSESI